MTRPELEATGFNDLRALAKERGVKTTTGGMPMKKDQIVEALLQDNAWREAAAAKLKALGVMAPEAEKFSDEAEALETIRQMQEAQDSKSDEPDEAARRTSVIKKQRGPRPTRRDQTVQGPRREKFQGNVIGRKRTAAPTSVTNDEIIAALNHVITLMEAVNRDPGQPSSRRAIMGRLSAELKTYHRRLRG